ncbi:MAG TPA: hypothetical protein VLU47_18445 [Blastocatellia bacterium]|nr:hypothetical protein [Blastocatellia bacterium]
MLDPVATAAVVPDDVVTTTTRAPITAPDKTVTAAVSCVPSAFTDRFEAVIAESTAPLEVMNLRADAPSRLTPSSV